MESIDSEYVKENINDEDSIFLRVHKVNIDFDIDDESKNIKPMAFDPKPTERDGLSVNWSKYADAKQTLQEVTLLNKSIENYGVISLPVKSVRQIPPLMVEHDPITFPIDNQSHSLIINIPQENLMTWVLD
jgi:hypothetical protein